MTTTVEIDPNVYLDCFSHLTNYEDDVDIELIFGGRDSGKSKFLSMLLNEACLSLSYFRCLLIKQSYESIKDAQWRMLKDTAEQWEIDSLFKYVQAPLEIRCENSNGFFARGMDNPAKIRSFSNPSHAWIEEASQLNKDAFIGILTGLRNDYGRVKIYLTFNPEADTSDYTDFWIYEMFYLPHEPLMSFTSYMTMHVDTLEGPKEIKVKYRSTHVTYQDNPYVSPQRIAFHESLKKTSKYWYRVFTLGLWGNVENDSPWAFAFSREKHVSNGIDIPHPVFSSDHELYLSWDFNRNPMTCTIIQHIENQVRILEVIRIPKSGVDAVCEVIVVKYPGALYIVTGDYNGNNESSLFHEQITHYNLIKTYLNLTDSQVKIRPNPGQARNSTHINNILAYYNVVIHAKNAQPMIFDLENVKRRADGTILKGDRDNPAQQSDALDCFTGDTLINTLNGQQRIDSIDLGTLVLTRKGYKPVIDRWASLADVYEFEFSDGTLIKCTKDHKFYTPTAGYVSILSIFENNLNIWRLKEDKYSSKIPLMIGSSITADVTIVKTGFTLSQAIRKTTVGHFIEKYGSIITDQFQKAMRSTTRIMTPQITRSKISSLERKVNTRATIIEKDKKKTRTVLINGNKLGSKLRLNGIDHLKELNGIDSKRSIRVLEQKNTCYEPVTYAQKKCVQKTIEPGFARIIAKANSDETVNLIQKPGSVKNAVKATPLLNTTQESIVHENVSPLPTHTAVKVIKKTYLGKQEVFDITVQDEHEFYANGILVHNCFRYWCNMFLGWFKPLLDSNIPPAQSRATRYQLLETSRLIGVRANKLERLRKEKEDPLNHVETWNPHKSLEKFDNGHEIKCNNKIYFAGVRTGLIKRANLALASGDKMRAQRCMDEVKRLDEFFISQTANKELLAG